MAAIGGYSANKLLVTYGPDVTDMVWDGDCEDVVVGAECVDGDIELTTEPYLLAGNLPCGT
jgi:hypothetical protein